MKKISIPILTLFLILTACKPANPLAGRPVTLLEFQSSSEKKELNVYLAQTPEEKIQGLMGVEQLPPNTGMLFIYDAPDNLGFWMKNMKISLDFVYLDENKRVVDLLKNIPPCQAKKDEDCSLYYPKSPSQYVLEVPAGWVEEVGVAVGDQFELEELSR